MKLRDLTDWMASPTGLQIPRRILRGNPQLPTDLPYSYHCLTSVGGPGLVSEQAFDVRGYQVRTVGPQAVDSTDTRAYDYAEDMAYDVDKQLCTADIRGLLPATVGGMRLIRINRIGSEPSWLMNDDANRTHFVCSYLFEVQSGY